MKNQLPLLCIALFLFFSLKGYSNGIGIIDGYSGIYFQLVESDIKVEVNNQIATITATQVLRNTSEFPVPVKYGFPLNENANPISLRWLYDGYWSEAVVTSNNQDNDIPGGGNNSGYEELDAYLVDYLGNTPLFFTPQDTILPDSTIVFELKYVELLPYFLGKVNFNFKNDITGLQLTPLDKQSFEFILNSDRDIINIDLLSLEEELITNGGYGQVIYNIDDAHADFNYDLEYELSSDGLGLYSLSTHIPDSLFDCDEYGDGYVTFIIEPESSVNTEVIQKNFTLVIDRSGSMSGDKIIQARDASSFIVDNLNAGDYFNVIDFSSDVYSLFGSLKEFNIENRDIALSYIDGISAGGSTNISGALTTAVSEFPAIDPNKANIILFFTDGQPTAGIQNTEGILEAVQNTVEAAETSIFLFSIGIGEDVNKGLLTSLSQQNNGLVNFIDPDNLQEEITNFFLSINNPVLINTNITFDPPAIQEVYPYPFPNLYKGQQLILSGRYTEAQSINMHIEGQAFNVPVVYDFEVTLADTNAVELSVLPKIWAKQKMDALTLEYYLAEHTSEGEEIQELIDEISTCYGVVSVDFSSFEDDGGTVVEYDYIDRESLYQINVYPLPFNEHLTIDIKTPKSINDEVVFELFDSHGKLIFSTSKHVHGNNIEFKVNNLGHFPPGVYYGVFTINGEKVYTKLMKG